MKAEEFANALTDINGKYIDEALDHKKIKSSFNVWRIVAIAACVCLAGSLALTAISLSGGGKSADRAQQTFATGAVYSNDYAEGGAYEKYAVEEAEYEYAAEEAMAYDDDMFYDYAYSTDEGTAIWNGADVPAEAAADVADTEMPAKIIYTVDMNLQTKEFDAAVSGIEDLVNRLGGYYESQSITNNSGSYRNAYYTIRIPADNLNELLDQIGENSTVTYMNRYAEDVSESYYDIKSRLTTAETKLGRLQELLKEAENMEDIITIESAISDTEWEIDNYSGTLRYYDSRVNFSTVNITLKEVYEVIVEDVPMTFGDKVSQAVSSGFKGFGDFLQDLVIWFASSWIWLVVIAAIVVIIIVIIKKHRNKKK